MTILGWLKVVWFQFLLSRALSLKISNREILYSESVRAHLAYPKKIDSRSVSFKEDKVALNLKGHGFALACGFVQQPCSLVGPIHCYSLATETTYRGKWGEVLRRVYLYLVGVLMINLPDGFLLAGE